MKKIISTLLLLVLLISLVSCGKEKPQSEPLVEISDISSYTLVYPDYPSELVSTACLSIIDAIEARAGTRLMLESDFRMPGVEAGVEEYEILVGSTNRALSQKALSLIKNSNDYIILVEGNEIAVVGASDDSTAKAAEKLIEYINASNAVLSLPEQYVFEYDYPLASINGIDTSSFDIVASKAMKSIAKQIQSAIYENSGCELDILESSENENCIYIEYGEVKYGSFSVKADEKSVYLSSSTENGIYYAVDYFLSLITGVESKNLEIKGEKIMSISEHAGVVYAADKFYNEDGTLKDSSAKLDLNIVYFGGSLTEGGTAWRDMTAKYFEDRFGGKVTAVNSGLGGTGTNTGAARFMTDVAVYEPDIVFIDFTLNDGGVLSTTDATAYVGQQVYLESIVRQASQLDKVPVIIVLHTPQPVVAEDEKAIKLVNGGIVKDRVLAHYGIAEGIVIYDQFVKEYEADKAAGKTNGTFFEWLGSSGHYRNQGDGYNVHPNQSGYAVYGNALLAAFEENGLEHYLKPIKAGADVYCELRSNIATASYNLIPATDVEKIAYSGDWKFYGKYAYDYDTYEDANSSIGGRGTYVNGEYKHGVTRHTYFLEDGLAQCYKYNNASFEFTTTADSVAFFYNAAAAINTVDVYVDNVKTSTLTFNSLNMPQYFMSGYAETKAGKDEEKTVRVVVADATESAYLFRYAYIVECFYGE